MTAGSGMATGKSRAHELKERIARGEEVHGIMAGDLATAPLVHLAAVHGLDFIVFDAEHCAFSEERVAQLAELSVLRGITPVVRVPPTAASVQKAIHLGAVGIMIPGVLDVAEARTLVAAAYLPPAGVRGFSTHSMPVRLSEGARWREPGFSRSRAVAGQNSWVAVILQIETASLLAALPQAAAIPGVDVLLLGATDLSVSLDAPDLPPSHPRIAAALAFDSGPAKGAVASDSVAAADWRRLGATFLMLGHDTELLERGLRFAVSQARPA
jgi:2-keto-3-deoxy-L-rhamnonate aldolase RhmA